MFRGQSLATIRGLAAQGSWTEPGAGRSDIHVPQSDWGGVSDGDWERQDEPDPPDDDVAPESDEDVDWASDEVDEPEGQTWQSCVRAAQRPEWKGRRQG